MAGSQDPRCQDSCHQKGTPVGVLSAALGLEGAVGVGAAEGRGAAVCVACMRGTNKEQRVKLE